MYHVLNFKQPLEKNLQETFTTELLSHHLLVIGQTGSGKTTTTLALLSQLQQLSQATIVLDPTGEYTRLPNCITYRLGENSYLEPGKLTGHQLLQVLGLPSTLSLQLDQAINDLRIQKNIMAESGIYRRLNRPLGAHQEVLHQLGAWADDYYIQDLFAQLIEEYVIPYPDHRADYTKLGQIYDRAKITQMWPMLIKIQDRLASPAFRLLFDTNGSHPGIVKTELNFVLKMFLSHPSTHRTLVIDLSALKKHESSQRLVISLLLKTILKVRLTNQRHFPVNIVIDEAHRYLPRDNKELADNGIFQLLREGRKGQLRLILTTQSPLDLPERLRSQFSNLIVHRLTEQREVTSISTGLTNRQTRDLPAGMAYIQVDSQPARLVTVNLPQWWGTN